MFIFPENLKAAAETRIFVDKNFLRQFSSSFCKILPSSYKLGFKGNLLAGTTILVELKYSFLTTDKVVSATFYSDAFSPFANGFFPCHILKQRISKCATKMHRIMEKQAAVFQSTQKFWCSQCRYYSRWSFVAHKSKPQKSLLLSSLNFYFQIAKFKPSFAVEKLGVREELVMMLQIDIFSEIITELLLPLFSCQTFSTVIYSVNRR